MTTATIEPKRRTGIRSIEGIRLREYQDANMTPHEMVIWLLEEVAQATRSDICGATGISWAAIDGIIQDLEQRGQIRRYTICKPEEYAWKR